MCVFEIMTNLLEGLGLFDVFPMISLEKLDIKHVPCVFWKIWHTHLKDSAWLTLSTSMGMTWRPLTYLRQFSIDFSWKIGYKTCVIYVFGNFDELAVVLPLVVFVDVPTWRTRPGWRCWRRWAWLGGLWHIWDHSQSISLEKLGVKHVSCMFLRIWHTHLWDSAWLGGSWPDISETIDYSLKIGY